jgi:hypothetical protein
MVSIWNSFTDMKLSSNANLHNKHNESIKHALIEAAISTVLQRPCFFLCTKCLLRPNKKQQELLNFGSDTTENNTKTEPHLKFLFSAIDTTATDLYIRHFTIE